MKQYPHTLTFIGSGTESTRNGNGDWIPGTEGDEIELSCRAEPNGSGKFIVGADGTNVQFAWIVYMPKGSEIIPEGANVKLREYETEFGSGTVKRFSKGQFNSRLWV